MRSSLDGAKCLRSAALFFLLILLTGAVESKAQTATILGVVRDASGAVVPQATLTARNTGTGQTRTAISSADGSYRFNALPVGRYEVQVRQAGFQSAVRSGLTLTVGREAIVNFSLQVGSVEQRVEVTAEAPLVNTTSGSLGGLVDEQKVSELPLNGRNYVDLALLQTGVQKNRIRVQGGGIGGTGYSSNGAPMSSNQTLIDGARANSMVAGTSATSASGNTLGVEGIQEFRVVTNALSAEYGMAMGSQMLIVSKSGTNAFHGSLFEYHRNDNLDARNFFDYQEEGSTRRLPPFVRNQFGGAIGGPILQDKTFFHTNLEALRERTSESRVVAVIDDRCRVDGGCIDGPIDPVARNWLDLWPSPNLPDSDPTDEFAEYADNPPLPINQNYGQVRVDHNFSEIDTIFGRYTIDDTDMSQPRNLPGVRRGFTTRAQYMTFSESHVFSPTVINQAQFSYSRSFVDIFDLYQNQAYADPNSGLTMVAGQPLGVINVGGLEEFNPSGSNPSGWRQQTYTWSDDLFYTMGAHSLKFGGLVNKFEQFMIVNSDQKGVLEFADVKTFLQGQADNFTATTPTSLFDRNMHFTTIGFYVQDDWRVNPRLTLNLGLRYEFSTQPTEVSGANGNLRGILDATGTLGNMFLNATKKNFSPRFGFAWDVMGDSMTAVRGGFGFLYDLGNMGQLFRSGGINPPFAGLVALEDEELPNPLTLPIPIPSGVSAKSIEVLDYYLGQPRVYQWNLTLERQLPWDTALRVGYVGSRGVRLWQPRELNARVPTTLADGQHFWPEDAQRPSPYWDDIYGWTTGGGSWYNALQVNFSKRLTHGLQFQTSYTYSHMLDDIQGQTSSDYNRTAGDMGGDPGNVRYDWASSVLDYRHNFTFNTIYQLPDVVSSGGFQGALVNGWGLSSIVTLNSGFPFTPVIANQWGRAGVRGRERDIDRPNIVDGGYENTILGTPDKWYSTEPFYLQPEGFKGNSQRNGLRGPGFATVDLSFLKNTAAPFLGEAGRLEFRAEFFNLLNRANFEFPRNRVFAGEDVNEEPLGNAGAINGTIGASRQIQLALKLVF